MKHSDLSSKYGARDSTAGLGACPTVDNMYDKLLPAEIYGRLGETSEITGAAHRASRADGPSHPGG